MEKAAYFEEFGQLTFVIHRHLRTYLTEGIDPAINVPHIYLLGFIKVHGPCIVTDISNYLGITLSGVTSLVNKLVAMNLVTRERSEEDRRIVKIFLTSEGEEIIKQVSQNVDKLFDKCFHNISDQEIEMFFQVHRKMNSNLLGLDDDETVAKNLK